MIEEAINKAKMLNKVIKRQHNLSNVWHLKLKTALHKIKVLIILTNKYRKNLKSKLEINSLKSYQFKQNQNKKNENILSKLSKLGIFWPSKKNLNNMKKNEEEIKILPNEVYKKQINSINVNDYLKNFGNQINNKEEIQVNQNLVNENITNSNNLSSQIKFMPSTTCSKIYLKEENIFNKTITDIVENKNPNKNFKEYTDKNGKNYFFKKKKKIYDSNITGKISIFNNNYLEKNSKSFKECEIINNSKDNRLIGEKINKDFILDNSNNLYEEVKMINNKEQREFKNDECLYREDTNSNNEIFKIEYFDFSFEAKNTNKFSKNSKKIMSIKNRSYLFQGNNKNQFSCVEISIESLRSFNNLAILIKSDIKTILVFLLYIYLWIYLMIFITAIYRQYGDNIFKICVMPLISMLVIKLAITFNVMMFLSTIILYFWGDFFMSTHKPPLLKMIIFKALVPPLAFLHYRALKTFRDLIKIV